MNTNISYFPEGPKADMPRNQQYFRLLSSKLKKKTKPWQLCCGSIQKSTLTYTYISKAAPVMSDIAWL